MKQFLAILLKLAVVVVLLSLLAVSGLAAWLFLYTVDLPDTSRMAMYSPGGTVVVSTTICGEPTNLVAIPGVNLRMLRLAVLASEGEPDPRTLPRRFYRDLASLPPGQRYGHYSEQLAQQMLCGGSGGNLKRMGQEIRTTIQLERHFTPDQLLDIYVNRANFGPHIYGAENAAYYYFGKHGYDLSTADAALLAGLLVRPAYFSPYRHPDRALARRDEVIDMLAKQGRISSDEAETAKRSPLGVVQHRISAGCHLPPLPGLKLEP